MKQVIVYYQLSVQNIGYQNLWNKKLLTSEPVYSFIIYLQFRWHKENSKDVRNILTVW